MKSYSKIIINKTKKATLAILLTFICLPLFSQTTQEEYNYITKGYKVQLESGLDMKKGYRFEDLGDWGLNKGSFKRICIFKALIRDGQVKPCAILMVYKRIDISNGANYFICIPSPDSSPEIWNQTLNFIRLNFRENFDMTETVIWALMKFSASEAAK